MFLFKTENKSREIDSSNLSSKINVCGHMQKEISIYSQFFLFFLPGFSVTVI